MDERKIINPVLLTYQLKDHEKSNKKNGDTKLNVIT